MYYGYCRISTPKQNINRQIRNILSICPDAKIITEVYTGTKIQGRKELDKLLKIVSSGDTIIFDSVSRMSRDAEEGFLLYQELFLCMALISSSLKNLISTLIPIKMLCSSRLA